MATKPVRTVVGSKAQNKKKGHQHVKRAAYFNARAATKLSAKNKIRRLRRSIRTRQRRYPHDTPNVTTMLSHIKRIAHDAALFSVENEPLAAKL